MPKCGALILVLTCYLVATSAFAAPIYTEVAAHGSIHTNGVDLFWSDAPFTVRAFHDDLVRPGSILVNEFAPFTAERLGTLWIVRIDRAQVPTCGGNQFDAYRGDWSELAYIFEQHDRDCTVPVCVDCAPPPSVPEPGALVLVALAGWCVWRAR